MQNYCLYCRTVLASKLLYPVHSRTLVCRLPVFWEFQVFIARTLSRISILDGEPSSSRHESNTRTHTRFTRNACRTFCDVLLNEGALIRPPSDIRITMKLSLTIAYAVQATLELAHGESNRPIPCSQLAERGKIPSRFLLQILCRLVRAAYCARHRGRPGVTTYRDSHHTARWLPW